MNWLEYRHERIMSWFDAWRPVWQRALAGFIYGLAVSIMLFGIVGFALWAFSR